MAPVFETHFVKSPQMNGPRNTAPIAPQDTPNILTIVAGLKYANITASRINTAEITRIKSVNLLSSDPLLIKPA